MITQTFCLISDVIEVIKFDVDFYLKHTHVKLYNQPSDDDTLSNWHVVCAICIMFWGFESAAAVHVFLTQFFPFHHESNTCTCNRFQT